GGWIARLLRWDGRTRDPSAVLDGILERVSQRFSGVVEEHAFPVGLLHQLGDPACACGEKRNACTERLVNRAWRVVERRWHDGELPAAAQVLKRLGLAEIRERPDGDAP